MASAEPIAAVQYHGCIMSKWILVVLIGFASSQVHAGEPIVTTDLLRLRTVTSIDVASDGARAVFALKSIASLSQTAEGHTDAAEQLEAEPSYSYQSHLFVVDLAQLHSPARQITFGDRADSSPQLSPDGKRIAFVRAGEMPAVATAATSRPADARLMHISGGKNIAPQIWILPIDGGEARQITNFEHGCTDPHWSPDGRRVLTRSELPLVEIDGTPPWPSERPKRSWKDPASLEGMKPRPDGTREQIRAWLDQNANRQNPVAIDRLEFQDEHTLRGMMQFSQLYLVDPDAISVAMTQQNALRITSGFFDHDDPSFMPDGQSVIYVSKKSQDQHPDRDLATTLWRVNIDGSNDRLLLKLEGWALGSPKPSPDGAVVAFAAAKFDEPAFRQRQLGIASLKGETVSEPVWLTDEGSFLGSVDEFQWMQTQTALAFTASIRGGTPLLTVSPGLIQPATLIGDVDGRPVGVLNFAVGGGEMVYSMCSAQNPCTLRVRDSRGDRLLIDPNPWIKDKTISLPAKGTLVRPDGIKVDYWIMEPTNREPRKTYPLVLEMHGGPSSMWGPGESTMWHEFQLLCSWGYGVVYANPRGSGGYGYEFQKKNFQDWGEGPAGDVLAAVDEAINKDWVDRERLVITGGSYAGYLTAWIVAHDNRFKAAVAQRGVYDFSTFYGEGNAWRLVGWAMGGPPYDPRFRPIIDRNNPMNFVTRIKTPLLITHGSADLRTGVSQSEMLYRTLKELNRPVEYIRYPAAGHDLSRNGDPMQRMDRLDRIVEFFERYVENQRPAPVASGN
jgi:dipeptidyl aminopeptidase/acylaminoacyl peptidase